MSFKNHFLKNKLTIFWVSVLLVLFLVFAGVIIADYFTPWKELCKNTLPFYASWSTNLPGNYTQYSLFENESFYKMKVSYSVNFGKNQMNYIEVFDKKKKGRVQYYFGDGFCYYDAQKASSYYYDPFAVGNCISTRGALIKINSLVVDEGAFAPPAICAKRTVTEVWGGTDSNFEEIK